MEIFVSGEGRKELAPNLIGLDYTFKAKEKTYEKAVEIGTKIVADYLQFLISEGFNKNEFKTSSMRVSEASTYDAKTKKYIKDGYLFVQKASIEFDYDLKRMAKIIEATSKLKTPPTYEIVFDIKDKAQMEDEIVTLAVLDAKHKAENIAKAMGMQIKECKRVEYSTNTRGFSGHYDMMECRMMSKESSAQNIEQVFVPEDIVLTKSVNCVFEA